MAVMGEKSSLAETLGSHCRRHGGLNGIIERLFFNSTINMVILTQF